jgi:hypothetical protein
MTIGYYIQFEKDGCILTHYYDFNGNRTNIIGIYESKITQRNN